MLPRSVIYFTAVLFCSQAWAAAARQSTGEGQMMPMPLLAPLFVEDASVSSTATIVNAAAAPTSADVILLDQQGMQIVKETITLPGHSQQVVQIGDLLSKAHSVAVLGSVQIMPEAKAAQSMSVVAQLSIVDNRPPVPAYLEEEFLMPSMKSSNVFQAAASSVVGHPVLALASTSIKAQTVTINCIRERAEGRTSVIQLAPGEMRLVAACVDGEQRLPAFDLALRQEGPEPKGAVGLSVATNGMPGELGVYGFVLRGERERPAYVALNFNDTATLRSSNTVFAGVPVGEADVLPGDHFIPEIALANFGLQPATATVLYATSGAGGAAGKTVAEITLAPQSSTTVRLPGLQGDPQMRNSFVVQSKAPPGVLAANLIAVGGATFRTVQLIGKDQQQMENGGAHPWTIEGGASSTLLLFNTTSSKQRFDVRIASQGVLWLRRYHLDGLETKAIDIGKLISDGEKDGGGKTLPKDARVGEVGWSTEGPGEGVGRLLVSEPARCLARNFSCGTAVSSCGSFMDIAFLNLLAEESGSMGPIYVQYCQGATACTGGVLDYESVESMNWSSKNSSIASVPSPADGSSCSVTGHDVGLATIAAAGWFSGCYQSTQGSANVQLQVQISAVQLSSSSMSKESTTGVTATVDISFSDTQAAKLSGTHKLTIDMSTYSSSPRGNNVAYNTPEGTTVTIGSATTSPATIQFKILPNASTQVGSIVMAATATADDSTLTVAPPSGTPPKATNNASLTITQ